MKKGFTLIELLVVVAIIGILATIIIINVASARAKAIDSKILAEMTEANKAAISCVSDNGDLTDPAAADATVCATAGAGLTQSWPNATGSNNAYGKWAVTSTAISAGSTTWSVPATDGTKTVTCTEKGCTKSW